MAAEITVMGRLNFERDITVKEYKLIDGKIRNDEFLGGYLESIESDYVLLNGSEENYSYRIVVRLTDLIEYFETTLSLLATGQVLIHDRDYDTWSRVRVESGVVGEEEVAKLMFADGTVLDSSEFQ